jgi:hypothetical protein
MLKAPEDFTRNIIEEFREYYQNYGKPRILKGEYSIIKDQFKDFIRALEFDPLGIGKIHCGTNFYGSCKNLLESLEKADESKINGDCKMLEAYLAQTKLPAGHLLGK